MTDPRIDQLAESARNRGLKLVRSRVRSPAKRRFGKVGLTDAKGKPVFGMDARGPVGKPEDVEDYLRNLGAKDWGASLDVAVLPRKRKATAVSRRPANDSDPDPVPRGKAKPAPASPPPPKPKPPKLRDAKPDDAARLAEMIRRDLGHDVTEKQVRKNLAALKKLRETPIVVTIDKVVVGVIGLHRMVTIHRPAPVGRIPILVVAEEAQGKGLGRLLVDAAEQWCRSKGCQIIEVTSNDRRAEAHAFYRHVGYERTSIRFFKKI
jgi:GNAT superfamily N-acetyltransferase